MEKLVFLFFYNTIAVPIVVPGWSTFDSLSVILWTENPTESNN